MYKQTNEWQCSRKTRMGALVLMSLLLILIVVWRLLPSLKAPKEDPANARLQASWSDFKKKNIVEEPEYDRQHEPSENSTYNHVSDQAENRQQQAHPEPFDPNTASEEELISVGFQPRTAKTIIKYRSKGGKFRRKEDLQKLYTLSAEDYERIAPYVRFGVAAQNTEASGVQPPYPSAAAKQDYEKPKFRTVELNGADADALLSLNGIGPAFSKRIMNFRNALGGFVTVEQLKEVYGFPDSTFQQLRNKVLVDAGKVSKLNINTAGEEELGKHPYIGRKIASNIIKRRATNGNFSEIEQLKQVPLINDEKYRKIAPYLSTH